MIEQREIRLKIFHVLQYGKTSHFEISDWCKTLATNHSLPFVQNNGMSLFQISNADLSQYGKYYKLCYSFQVFYPYLQQSFAINS